MSEILLYYKRPDPTTWVYLSSFLTIGLYFVFHRFWSVRNLDIVLLILLAPGLLVVYEGRRRQLLQTELLAREKAEQSFRPPPSTSDLNLRPDFASADRHASTRLVIHQNNAEPNSSVAASDETDLAGESSVPDDRSVEPAGQSPQNNRDAIGRRSTDPNLDPDLYRGPPQQQASQNPDGPNPDRQRPDGLRTDPGDRDFGAAGGVAQSLLNAGGYAPTDIQRFGFIYLFVVQAFLLLRLMIDPLMVRRPLLDPNLTTGGLNFIGISLFIFMMANVIASSPRIQVEQGPALGPGYALMNMLPAIPTRPVSEGLGGATPPTNAELTPSQAQLAQIAKSLAILAQLAIVAGIVLIGNRHFSNLRAGVGCATLYLMLPYTAQMTGRVDHALPAALLLWAVLSYRRPMIAGIFLGLAGGLVYYPLFLLPLWFSFYWQRGARSFAVGVVAMLALLMVALSFDDSASLAEHLRRMFGVLNPNREAHELRGIWALGWNPIWRLPVIVAFVILSVFFAIWPAQKNLGTLMSGTAAVMVAAQFWHGYGGGLYIAWFLPLLLLTIFRPNLQDRIATKVVVQRLSTLRQNRVEREAV